MTHDRRAEALIQEILKDDYTALKVTALEIKESPEEGTCWLAVELAGANGGAPRARIEAEGVGFVDALYRGLLAHYAERYQSLKTIRFTRLRVKGDIVDSGPLRADAEAMVELVVENHDGRAFTFEARGRSTAAATSSAVVSALEYFINSERAFISIYHALQDAKARHRSDLIQRYTQQLSDLVVTTSYTEVIQRIREEAL
ncbi:hypothetical protein KKF91_16820 [Myxococcota bacterium]|nr:hypothetical protein [Myxococcota bacterium]MBU1432201.1 hypothetical protein [Myxococcota bacterium]MBU1900193.1 hypothetical protein [Myxococcota bacterium]